MLCHPVLLDRNRKLENSGLGQGRLEIVDILELWVRLAGVEDLVVAQSHQRVRLVGLADARTARIGLELPSSHPGGLAVLDGVCLQHDGTLIEDELAHGLLTAFAKDLEANEVGEIVGDEIVDELAQEAFANRREIGERAVLVLVGAEPVLAEDKDVAVDRGGVNVLDLRDLGPAALGSLEVGA